MSNGNSYNVLEKYNTTYDQEPPLAFSRHSTDFLAYLFKAMCLSTQLHIDLQVVVATVTFKTNINANPT